MSKLILWTNGDMSVGIPGTGTEIDLGYEIEWEDKEQRNDVGQIFIEVFRDLWDCATIHYHYDDECTNCGKQLTTEDGKCSNPHCNDF